VVACTLEHIHRPALNGISIYISQVIASLHLAAQANNAPSQ
jgi:hypothetical protein